MNEVEEWKKRTKKKSPLYLYDHTTDDECNIYTVIFKDKRKIKIGILRDGMLCRYGIRTFGSISCDPDCLLVWGGDINQEQLDAMKDVRDGKSILSTFDVDLLKNLRY